MAYAAREDDPTPLVADIFQAHKRISYDKKMAVKIMDDDNRDIAIFIINHMLNTFSRELTGRIFFLLYSKAWD